VSTRLLMVDWLGRGGIAQSTEAWALELGARSYDVDVVTRPGRELGDGLVGVHRARPARGRVAAHRAVADAAAYRIRETVPNWVVVQNYVVPVLEQPVFRAAREVGSGVVVVVHDHRLHTWAAGTHRGLRKNLRAADLLVTHSHFVAEHVARATGRNDVVVLPLPVPIGMLWHARVVPPALADQDDGALWCAHFGILNRAYKGTDLVTRLAAETPPRWRFVLLGTGAERSRLRADVVTIGDFVPPGDLVGAVSATDVTLAPYRVASQSAVVVLAHALGSVPLATAVGGIPEQVTDGIDGVLVNPSADMAAWREALDDLGDDDHRKQLAVAGEARAWADHEAFVNGAVEALR